MEDHDDLYVIKEGVIYDAHTGERLGVHDQNRKPFDAPAHMRKIRTRQGMQDYLDVKWRVAWLRADFPASQLVTEQIEGSAEHARFKCTITLPSGGVATGHGSETQNDFPDFYEKAETKAIGRACAALGYGTDTAGDFDDATQGTIEPAPVARQHTHESTSSSDTFKQRSPNPVPPPTPQEDGSNQRGALERLKEVSGAHTVPLRSGGRSERATTTQKAREKEMMAVAVPGFKPDGGAVKPPEQEAQEHLASMQPPQPPTPPKQYSDPPSNVHQHAQLRAMADAGIPVLERMKAQTGKETLEALTREEAKNLIVECRADARRLATS